MKNMSKIHFVKVTEYILIFKTLFLKYDKIIYFIIFWHLIIKSNKYLDNFLKICQGLLKIFFCYFKVLFIFLRNSYIWKWNHFTGHDFERKIKPFFMRLWEQFFFLKKVTSIFTKNKKKASKENIHHLL